MLMISPIKNVQNTININKKNSVSFMGGGERSNYGCTDSISLTGDYRKTGVISDLRNTIMNSPLFFNSLLANQRAKSIEKGLESNKIDAIA